MEDWIIRNVGQEESGASASSERLEFGTGNSPRQGVLVCAIGADAYVKFVNGGTTSGVTVSSTDHHFKVPQGSTLTLKVARSVSPWITSSGSWRALELS